MIPGTFNCLKSEKLMLLAAEEEYYLASLGVVIDKRRLRAITYSVQYFLFSLASVSLRANVCLRGVAGH